MGSATSSWAWMGEVWIDMSERSPQELASEARDRLAAMPAGGDALKGKDRLAIPPQEMPAQDAVERSHNFTEV